VPLAIPKLLMVSKKYFFIKASRFEQMRNELLLRIVERY
jgi:hypothetical protein